MAVKPGAVTFSSVLGARLRGLYLNSNIQQAAGVATLWKDSSGLGQDLTAQASPVYNAVDGLLTPAGPTVSLNGTSQYFDRTTFTMGGGSSLFVMVVSQQTANGGEAAGYNGNYAEFLTFGNHTAGQFSMLNNDSGDGAVATENGSSTLNLLSCAWGWADHTVGASKQVQCATGTNAPVTASGTIVDTQPDGHFYLGGGLFATFMTGKLVGALVANSLPSASEIATLVKLWHNLVGV